MRRRRGWDRTMDLHGIHTKPSILLATSVAELLRFTAGESFYHRYWRSCRHRVTNDIFAKENGEFLVKNGALPEERIRAVVDAPHAAIHEELSINLKSYLTFSKLICFFVNPEEDFYGAAGFENSKPQASNGDEISYGDLLSLRASRTNPLSMSNFGNTITMRGVTESIVNERKNTFGTTCCCNSFSELSGILP